MTILLKISTSIICFLDSTDLKDQTSIWFDKPTAALDTATLDTAALDTATLDTATLDTATHDNSTTYNKHKKLKPGTKIQCATKGEQYKRQKQALRMQKSRALKTIQKCSQKLCKQSIEPAEFVFVMKEIKKNKYKYFGTGSLLKKLESGKVLLDMDGKSKKLPVDGKATTTQALTPGKYPFSFTGSLAEDQRQKLDNVEVQPATSTPMATSMTRYEIS
jgi:hypothetical protein